MLTGIGAVNAGEVDRRRASVIAAARRLAAPR
jgi:hypothetical protein